LNLYDSIYKFREVQSKRKIYGDADMGGKKYTMEPTITGNFHWGDIDKNGNFVLRSYCIGTRSFSVGMEHKLTKIQQKKLKRKIYESDEDSSSSSSTWGEIENL